MQLIVWQTLAFLCVAGKNPSFKISKIEAHFEEAALEQTNDVESPSTEILDSDEYIEADARERQFQLMITNMRATIGHSNAAQTTSKDKAKKKGNIKTKTKHPEKGTSDDNDKITSKESDFEKEHKPAETESNAIAEDGESDEYLKVDEEEAEIEQEIRDYEKSLNASDSNLEKFEFVLKMDDDKASFKNISRQLPPSRRYKPRTRIVASLDATELESELMSYKVNENETVELRELLRDPLKLQENKYSDSHRDFGSSFILPVLSATNYDNCTVPLIFADIPVNVVVQLNIIHISNFDSVQMEYTIDLELEMRWYDLRLRSNYSKPILLREKPVIDRIWRPDPYFVNSKYSYFHLVSFPNFRMRITPEGLVTYTMRVTLLPSCQMVFCKYPHDRQRCDLQMSSIAYPHSFVNFSWHTAPFTFKTEIALPELRIHSISSEVCEVESKLIGSSCLRLLFLLERDGGRFIVEKYVPSTLAMMFAWVAPYVPYNYEDVRIVTPIMVLLALVQMEKDDSAIRTSYLTSMNVWFGVMKAFSVLSLIESLIILAFIKRSRAMEKNLSRAVSELEKDHFLAEKRKALRRAHTLDQICRVLSPFTFLLFFNYYVLFVAQGDDNDCIHQHPYHQLLSNFYKFT